MLFTQLVPRIITSIIVFALVFVGLPVLAEDSNHSAAAHNTNQRIVSSKQIDSQFKLSNTCPACGAEIVLSTDTKDKKELLITDSLWGNLILEMAYQRDNDLAKLAKQMSILNTGTMVSIGAIAAGTLAQGIVSLATLNPPAGMMDSYAPGKIGVPLSGATILTLMARGYFGHKIQSLVREQQLTIKHNVEAVLSHLENSHATCAEARHKLVGLIGERASNEWLQLWYSSHQVASNDNTPHISLTSSTGIDQAIVVASEPNMVP